MIVKFFYSKSATIGVMKDTIRILHINDLHSHFEQYPQLKRAVDDLSQTD
ncbi:MAG: bifunctional metallophosphatase/5'-nucleotidase, partial [Streptococcus salivarius]